MGAGKVLPILLSKRLVVLTLVALAFLSLISNLNSAKAIDLTGYKVIASSGSDGYTMSGIAAWATAWNATSAYAAFYSGTYFEVGMENGGGSTWDIRRGYLYFDTSVIPDTATITSAKLFVHVYAGYLSTSQNLVIQSGGSVYPHDPLVVGDYWQGWYSGNGGSQEITELVSTYTNYNITLSATGISWLNPSGRTRFCLRLQLDIDNLEPIELMEFVRIHSKEYSGGWAYWPKLYVEYSISDGKQYNLRGPYFESGQLAPYLISVTCYKPTEPYESFTLDGSGGYEDTYQINSTETISYFTWNISSPATNKTRTFYASGDSVEEILVFIPNDDEPFYVYTFSVLDVGAGITGGFLESVINVNGSSYVVERLSLNVLNSLPFWFSWAHRYDMRLLCDQGSYTFGGFIALSEASQTLIITASMFPIAYQGQNITVAARRQNATWIQINYTDSETLTFWVHYSIKVREGQTWTEVYSTNASGQTQQLNWYGAESTANYLATVTASREEIYTFTFSLPAPASTTNVWENILDLLGSLPFPVKNAIGFVLVLVFAMGFSYIYTPFAVVGMALLAAFLTYIGWLDLSVTAIGVALALALIYVLTEEHKKHKVVEAT